MFKGRQTGKVGRTVSAYLNQYFIFIHATPQDPIIIHAKLLVLCTGLHVIPSIPEIPGIEYVLNPEEEMADKDSRTKPAIFHSVNYKNREQLCGRRVMVLGTGETGMDLAYESAKAGAKEVVLCTRGG